MKDNKYWEWIDTFIPTYIDILGNCDYNIVEDKETMRELQTYIHTKDNERWHEYISQKFDVWSEAREWAKEIVERLQKEFPDKELGAEEIDYITEAIYEQNDSNYEDCILKYAHCIVFTWKIPNAWVSENTSDIEDFLEQVKDNEILKKIPFGIMLDAYRNLIYDGGEFIIGFKLSREDIDKLIKQNIPTFHFKDVFFGMQNYEVGAGFVGRYEELYFADGIYASEIEIDNLQGDYGWSAWIHESSINNAEIK